MSHTQAGSIIMPHYFWMPENSLHGKETVNRQHKIVFWLTHTGFNFIQIFHWLLLITKLDDLPAVSLYMFTKRAQIVRCDLLHVHFRQMSLRLNTE